MKVLIVDKVNEVAKNILVEAGIDVVVEDTISNEGLCRIIPEFDGIILRNVTKITQDVIDVATNLKIIARAGVGVDNIDVEYAAQKGIWVVNSPDGNTEATAEHTISMILSVSRNIPQAYETLKNGQFTRSKFMGSELKEKKIGIVGFGRIGRRVAEIAKVFGLEIYIYDPYANQEDCRFLGYFKIDVFDDLLPICDYITVHVPKTQETINLINKDNIYKIKQGARLINCARGGIINEIALLEALKNHHIAGAALDVFEGEPNIEQSPLFKASENLIIVPHLGAMTVEAQIKVAKDVAIQTVDVLNGKRPKTPLINLN